MRTIWKFPLEIEDRQIVRMPDGAKILTVQVQGRTPCLWALVDPDKPLQQRSIQMFYTGYPARDAGVYISTFQLGPLVFHVFESREEVIS